MVLGAALLHSTTGDFTPVDLYTKKAFYTRGHANQRVPDDFHNRMRVHKKLFSPKDPNADAKLIYTRRNLRQIQNMFAPRTFYTRKPSTRGTLYTSLLYTKDFYTRRLLHQNPFTPQGPCIYTPTVYTKNALRRGNWNQTTLTRKNFYTKQLFTTLDFPSEIVCTRSLLTPEAFSPGTCTPCNKLTPEGKFQQKFSHQRSFTAKPFKTRDVRIC